MKSEIFISVPFSHSGDSRNKTRPAEVVVVANSKQKVFSRTHNVVKYTPKKFGYDYFYTLLLSRNLLKSLC